MKKIIILSLLFFSCTDKKFNSETITSDSLSIYLNLANQDTVSYKNKISYTNRAYEILQSQENDSLNRKNFFKVANRYYNNSSFEKFKKVTSIILEKSSTEKDSQNIAKAFSYLGDYYAYKIKNDSAFFYYNKAEEIYFKLNDSTNLGGAYISKATVQNNENDFLGGESSAIKALNVLRSSTNKEKIYEAYNILGVISYNLKNYEESIKYHTKALNYVKENKLSIYHEEAGSLNNLGCVYIDLNKNELAVSKFKLALENKLLLNDKSRLYATLLDNLAYSKFKLNDDSQLPELFYQSLKIRDSLDISS